MGVCVGMQMLLDHSEEQDTPGLGLIPGEVRRFGWTAGCSPTAAATRCRRWAGTACASKRTRPCARAMWQGVPDGSWFYFVHSYHVRPADEAPRRRPHRLRRALYLRDGPG
jgi:glutamine amidotransferase